MEPCTTSADRNNIKKQGARLCVYGWNLGLSAQEIKCGDLHM